MQQSMNAGAEEHQGGVLHFVGYGFGIRLGEALSLMHTDYGQPDFRYNSIQTVSHSLN
jgi:hypothetical protein